MSAVGRERFEKGYTIFIRKDLTCAFSSKTDQELLEMHKTSLYTDTCTARRRIRMANVILPLNGQTWQIYYEPAKMRNKYFRELYEVSEEYSTFFVTKQIRDGNDKVQIKD